MVMEKYSRKINLPFHTIVYIEHGYDKYLEMCEEHKIEPFDEEELQ